MMTPTVFLDIGTKFLWGGEQGLLGLTFHPQVDTNRRFFVNYTRKPDGATVIAQFLVSPGDANVADPLSETVFLVIPHPFVNHNGGMIEFGPYGFLYIATGDGGGTLAFDADANGSNERSAVTDDPGTAAAGDATAFVAVQPPGADTLAARPHRPAPDHRRPGLAIRAGGGDESIANINTRSRKFAQRDYLR